MQIDVQKVLGNLGNKIAGLEVDLALAHAQIEALQKELESKNEQPQEAKLADPAESAGE